MLWFDVEERYNTTARCNRASDDMLWFDVEERYNTTDMLQAAEDRSCGLM